MTDQPAEKTLDASIPADALDILKVVLLGAINAAIIGEPINLPPDVIPLTARALKTLAEAIAQKE